MKRTILRSLLAIVILAVGYLFLWPVPINPVTWTPPKAPELSGVYAQNSELSKIERLPHRRKQTGRRRLRCSKIEFTVAMTRDTFFVSNRTEPSLSCSPKPKAGHLV
jgi:hypothetical protein